MGPSARLIRIGALPLACAAILGMSQAPLAQDLADREGPLTHPSRPARQEEPRPPGPRRKIAGQHAIHAISRVRFGDPGISPHLLTTSIAFPERVRTELRREGGRESERRIAYLFGERCWNLAPGSPRGDAIEGELRHSVRLEFSLRRALLLWPHGNSWSTPEDGVSRAEVDDPELEATLVARGGEGDSGPESIAIEDGSGEEKYRLEGIEWSVEGGRYRPSSLAFYSGSTQVWTQEFLVVERRSRFTDSWFVPPDRRKLEGKVSGKVTAVDLEPALHLWIELEPGGSVGDALTRARRTAATVDLPEGLELSDEIGVRLDANGSPSGVLVRAWGGSTEPPEGWTAFRGLPGLSCPVETSKGSLDEARGRLLSAADLESDARKEWLLLAARKSEDEGARLVLLLEDVVR